METMKLMWRIGESTRGSWGVKDYLFVRYENFSSMDEDITWFWEIIKGSSLLFIYLILQTSVRKINTSS